MVKLTTTYVKLQAAYASEKSQYGGWKLIGYSGPGTNSTNSASSYTTNFKYTSARDNTGESNEGVEADWSAENIAKLNDCDGGVHWKITTEDIAEGGVDTYTAWTDCKELTPNFEAIGGGSGS